MKKTLINNQRGVALVTSLMIMSLLAVIGFSALNNSDIELKIAGNERVSTQALYAAEAGVQQAISVLRENSDKWDDLLEDDPIPITPVTQDSDDPNPGTIGGGAYVFDIYKGTNDDRAVIRSTGTTGNSFRNLHVTVERIYGGATIDFGAFGDIHLEIDAGGSVRSYDSDTTLNPTDRDADGDYIYDSDTLEGDVGSNEQITLRSNTYVSGTAALGETTDGDAAELKTVGKGIIVLGTESFTEDVDGNLILTGENIDRVDADFLFHDGGVVNNAIDELTSYSGAYDALDLTTPLTAAESPYYFENITLGNEQILRIINDASNPINIFVFGKIDVGNGGAVKIESAVVPQKFQKSGGGGDLFKSEIGTTPVYVDDHGVIVTKSSLDDNFYKENGEPAHGRVYSMLSDGTNLIYDQYGEPVLMDNIFFVRGEDPAYAYSGVALPGGVVNIFTTSDVEFKNGSELSNFMYVNGEIDKPLVDLSDNEIYGSATLFSLFSTTTGIVDFKNSSSVSGLIYTPYAKVNIMNEADLYGAVYGKQVHIKNSGEVWFDTALKDKYSGLKIVKIDTLSWLEL